VSAVFAFRPPRRLTAMLAAIVFASGLYVAAAAVAEVRVVVTSTDERSAADAVASVGGAVESSLPIIGGVVANVPADRIGELSTYATVVRDRAMHVRSVAYDGSPSTAYPYEVGATEVWNDTAGAGVGVALVDTGVAPVPDLLDRVVAVADLTPEHAMADGYGHGTFMAGLIAGNGTASEGAYTGVAPLAHLVSIKVALSDGSTTLGTVLEALQLVDRSREKFNIRVMLLALSSDSDASPDTDPLTHALRKLWDHGVFVVVPAGNDGPDAGSVDLPGNDPVLMTAGAIDDMGTRSVSDDQVPSWTSRGPSRFGDAKPDVAAPGVHLVSLRAPGSVIDHENPSARVGEMYFRGSGTSMSAAVTAGVGALVLAAHPDMSPDEVKAALVDGATPLDGADASAVGAGVVNASATSADVAAGERDPRGSGRGEGRGAGTAVTGTRGSGTGVTGTAWSGTAVTGTRGSGTAVTGTRGSGTRVTGSPATGTVASGKAGTGSLGIGTAARGPPATGTGATGKRESGTAGTGNPATGRLGTGRAGCGRAAYG
jgi:serine protease AprX